MKERLGMRRDRRKAGKEKKRRRGKISSSMRRQIKRDKRSEMGSVII